MQQRGRTSAASLVGHPAVDGEPPRLEPPAHLTHDEETLFAEIVHACSPRHFVVSDTVLLETFVRATLLARHAIKGAAKDAAALSVWEKAARIQAMLATRLRLAPQSRADPKSITRRVPTGPKPWELK